ncbi:DNA-binding domain-containing protein [Pseudoalteromonas sp.]|uniref:DNA-binding domain-containing protein n=1 Tax=Pseudoalteromonas sp. TaxID=53249 RepID=UPI003002FC77
MSDLATLQQQFMALLQGQNNELANHIASHGQLATSQRLAIYQNAYKLRLRAAIEQDHAQLGIYLGDELFDKMVAEYLVQYPSNYTSLRFFADDLPHYLRNNSPFSEHPILADIAQFERLLLTAFDAQEHPLLTVDELESLTVEQWSSLRLALHPSVQLTHFNSRAVESWQAIKDKQLPPEPNSDSTRYWVVARDCERRTQFINVDLLEYRLLTLLRQQVNFVQLCQSCITDIPSEQITGFLINLINQWLERGWLVSATK